MKMQRCDTVDICIHGTHCTGNTYGGHRTLHQTEAHVDARGHRAHGIGPGSSDLTDLILALSVWHASWYLRTCPHASTCRGVVQWKAVQGRAGQWLVDGSVCACEV